MSRRIPATLVLAVLASVPLSACGEGDGAAGGPPMRVGTGPGSYLASLPIQTVGGKVDLGPLSPCGGSVARAVRIRNQSPDPVTIINYSPNCACLTADLKGSMTLEAGEEREVALAVHPSGHGHRSTSVEFGGKGGLLGSIRVDWSLNAGVSCVPLQVALEDSDRDQAVDVAVFGTDGKPVKVLGIEPPVGSVEVASGDRCKVVLSGFEARRFAESEQGKAHPGAVIGPDGRVTAPIRPSGARWGGVVGCGRWCRGGFGVRWRGPRGG